MSVYEKLREWVHGLYRIKGQEINRLKFPEGVLLKLEPPEGCDTNMVEMQKALYVLWHYPGRFSFEIWKDKGIEFYFFSSRKTAEGVLKSQLDAVYPQVHIQRAEKNLPEITPGEIIACSYLKLYGQELSLRCAEDFRRDPYHHILGAVRNFQGKAMIQILFEPLRRIPKDKLAIVVQKYRTIARVPLFRCLIRIMVATGNEEAAKDGCDAISTAFTVFDTGRAQLHPVPLSLSFPLINSPYPFLKKMNERKFSLLRRGFMISVPELATFVHLPSEKIGGVQYHRAELEPPSHIEW